MTITIHGAPSRRVCFNPAPLSSASGENYADDWRRWFGIFRVRSRVVHVLHEALGSARGMGITSNLAFILYGYIVGIEPVLVLHLILLPVNIIRLVEALGANLPSALFAAARGHHLFKDLRIRPP